MRFILDGTRRHFFEKYSEGARRRLAFAHSLGQAAVMDEAERSASDALENQTAEIRTALGHFYRRRGVEAQEIDDLVQDVFLRLATRGSLEEIDNLRGYALRAAEAVLIDRGRRRAVRHQDGHVELDPERHASEATGPDRIVAGQDALDHAVSALMTLPERTRSVFILRRMEGMRFRDIAQQLGLSLSSVEKHMVRAVEHMLAAGKDQA